jgi:hypothetical protein
MNNQNKMSATLADLLRTSNGIYARFTWFYGNNWIRDIQKSDDKVEVEVVDRKDIRKTFTLDSKTTVRNYEV